MAIAAKKEFPLTWDSDNQEWDSSGGGQPGLDGQAIANELNRIGYIPDEEE